MIERLQAGADRNIKRFDLLADGAEAATCPARRPTSPGTRRPPVEPVGTGAGSHLTRVLSRDAREPALMEKPFAITLDVGSSLANKTGTWRTERAVYVDRLPPCNHACPAGENIQAWLYEAEEGDGGYERAWRKIMEDNPFPAIMGRVCYHPCETSCNRAQLDEAVGINSVERFLGDEAIRAAAGRCEPSAEPSGKRVLVVGAGPSGLSAAYHLAPARPRGDDPRGRARWQAG